MNTYKYSHKQLTEEFFKKSIFSGHVIIIKKSDEIFNIIKTTERYFIEVFDENIANLRLGKLKPNKEVNKLFVILQNRIKYSKAIKNQFSLFLDRVGLLPSKTFIDMITLRFSPREGRKSIGNLMPTGAHRDTWASNIFNQINFWFPIHNVSENNSIFLIPSVFNKKALNNSNSWNYVDYKKKKINQSVPTTSLTFKNSEKIKFKLKKGEVLCFSGHHLHGSKVGDRERINIETRIANRLDCQIYNIPKNIDSLSTVQKSSWFRNIKNGKKYS